MCAICGVFDPSGAHPVDRKLLVAMRDSMKHRGPDDQGIYISEDGYLGLGHRRLSIIDLSTSGRQPMCNDGGSLWIVFNGEIYNFADHRADLARRGHRFRSQTDTEVILHLYEEHGVELVHKLRGMFAFAIWDVGQRRLFLARDRLGIKPLYYTTRNGRFLFASEIKALLQDPTIPRRVNEEALYHYLSFLAAPAPTTLFDGIFKLPAGHRMIVDAEGRVRTEEYWDVFDGGSPASLSPEDYATTLRQLLQDSVRTHLMSDVPTGVLLSGGIDSTTITALTASLLDHPVRTFSIGFHGSDYPNEFEYARLASQTYGTDHHQLSIGVEQMIDFLSKLVYHQDEPIADPVCVPVYYVSQLAKERGTTVIQVGEGSDELFAYPRWVDTLDLYDGRWQTYGRLPRPLRRLGAGLASQFSYGDRAELLRRAAYNEELFWGGAEAFTEGQKRRLLSPRLRKSLKGLNSHQVVQAYRERFLERSPLPDDYLAWMGYLDLHLRLPELLLMRVDKMSMATSVEARVPFLDHEVVSFAMNVPRSAKLGGTGAKHPDGSHTTNREGKRRNAPVISHGNRIGVNSTDRRRNG